tara:strand:- start:15 stop:791 length:777 start_codon:yes stop_codon:yes gene_type:complete
MNILLHKASFILISIIFITNKVSADDMPNYEREKSLHNQFTSYVFDADIIELHSKLENKFNLLSTDNSSETSVLLLHGRGLHPSEPNIIDPIRVELIENNYNVYSLQLPVLAKDKTYYDYLKIIKYSDARIHSSINFIKSKNIVVIAHSCGVHMLFSYIENIGINNISKIILLGAGAVDKNQVMKIIPKLSSLRLPILNIYAEYDHNSVKLFADNLKLEFSYLPESRLNTIEVEDAGHDYNNQSYLLIETVKKWLKSS